jgi:hypothetical protein
MPFATREDYEEIRRADQREEFREKVKTQRRRLDRIAPKTDMRGDLDEQIARWELWQQRERMALLAAELRRELDELNELNELNWRLDGVDRLPIPEAERCRLRERINRDYQQRQQRK